MWLAQKEAVGTSSSCVIPQSPEKKEMAALKSKRRDKEEKKNRCFSSSCSGMGEESRSMQDTSKTLLEIREHVQCRLRGLFPIQEMGP